MTLEQIFNYQKVSTPLLVVRTHDHIEFENKLIKYYQDKELKIDDQTIKPAIFEWSPIQGVQCLTGMQHLTDRKELGTVIEAFRINTPPATLLLVPVLSDRILTEPSIAHLLIEARETLQKNRMLILIVYDAQIPETLRSHVMVINDKFPTKDAICDLAKRYIDQYLNNLDDQKKEALAVRTGEVLAGLGLFGAEQIIASCLNKYGLNFDTMWKLKCEHIALIPGLSISMEKLRFSDIGGLVNIKQFCDQLLYKSKNPPNVLVWLDEVEKMLAGSEGSNADNTGVSQGILQALLTYMQEQEVRGMIFLGPPGTGKSMTAKAIAGEGEIPSVYLDLGAMKASRVGHTETNVRRALNTLEQISGGRQLWVATCNSLTNIPAALRRRFTYGLWFFDLPTAEENTVIWKYYIEKFGLDIPVPGTLDFMRNTDNIMNKHKFSEWTGAEIKMCCTLMSELGLSLEEARKYIVPISASMYNEISKLRKEATHRYLSASFPGVYTTTKATSVRTVAN